ncbi:heme ABC transporter ATP-binding protein [uncultured Corynebacterium sp.]|uniref:heme ABC transporter ATP-binding protein n=1 Tax=uncultured Corynebacterium sp. TaxID=159447 RepID=UPI0025CC7598|nr:heme ABC transporter ATP-binding protein [uncultured Corynebacterium sp.]
MISLDNVALRLGDKPLLRGVSFTVAPGEVTGLIGPNGAGKSTLLAAVSGDLEYSGSITLGGLEVAATGARELARVRAVMLQDVGVSFEFLARDVVAMGRRPWEGTEREAFDDAVVDAALDACDVAHLAARDVVTLSGGERARVALARVLAQNTPVVLLDEPTAALDIKHQEQVLGLVRQLAGAGVAVLVVLHDLEAAAAWCDSIVCLSAGEVAAQGPVEEVYTSELLSRVYDWPIAVEKSGGRIAVHPQRPEGGAGDTAPLIELLGGGLPGSGAPGRA